MIDFETIRKLAIQSVELGRPIEPYPYPFGWMESYAYIGFYKEAQRDKEQIMIDEKSCCEEWDYAQHWGTDNESYSCAINKYNGNYSIGGVPKPVKFCPWCGDCKEKSLNQSAKP